MIVKQLSVFVENKPGRISVILDALAKHPINIQALSLADASEFGVLRLIVDDIDSAKALLRQIGVIVKTTEVLAVEMEHVPGGAAAILSCLAAKEIAVEYVFAGALQQQGKIALFLRTKDLACAQTTLMEAGYLQA